MASPVQISFHGLDHSDAVETAVRERLDRLGNRSISITGGRVVIEAHHHSHTHLNVTHRPFRVAIHLDVPGARLTANHDDKDPKSHADIDAAIRDAFKVIERKLKQHAERRGGSRRRTIDDVA